MEREKYIKQLLSQIDKLTIRLEESDQLIEAIKAGEVDAFAITKNENEPEVYTLRSGDYAYRVLIEEFKEGALNVTEEGLIVYANPYFSELLNIPYGKIIGTFIFDYVDSGFKKTFQRLFDEALSGNSKGEIILANNNKTIPVYISLKSLLPKLATVGIIVTDLTQKKKHEEEITKYQNDLEANNIELINRNTELASFAYVASHDLQEPLRKIQTFVSMIRETEELNITLKGKEYLTRMHKAASRMQILILDLLTYSRTNAVKRKYEKTDLNKIIDEVQLDLKDELEEKQAIIEVKDICNLDIIQFQFYQLMLNLVSNSLKYSDPSIPPHINIVCKTATGKELRNTKLLPETEYVHICFSDNGIGFAPQYNEKIFELFQRLHGKNEYSGTGIGLAIVKKIVENHGGIITANGKVNHGATFDIYIPVGLSGKSNN